MISPGHRSSIPLLLLSLGLSACLPDLKDDTAACNGPEICNGEDDDCNGSVDDNATDAPNWYPDADGDGYGDSSTSVLSCAPPTGYVAEDKATGDNADCDDTDDDAYPGATETWYDGVDADCDDASDYDQDGDGHDHDAFGGDDCDDEDATVHPGQSEVWYDDVDQDCSGGSDYDQDGDEHDSWEHDGDDCDDVADDIHPGADEIWYDGVDQDCDGRSDYDQDYDGHDSDAHSGDDCDDAVATIYPGAIDDWYDGIDADCAGDSDYDQDGDGHDSDDYDGGDCDDEEPGIHPDALEWIDGEDNNCDGDLNELVLGNAPVELQGEAGGDGAGCSVAGVGDVNADGYDDVLIGAYGNTASTRDSGAAYLLYGPISSSNLSSADAKLGGWDTGGMAGYSISKAGDLNADGMADLFVGTPWEGSETSMVYTGAAYVMYGPVTGDVSLEDSNLIMRASNYDDGAGWHISGGVDATGDGTPDLLLGATDISTHVDYGGGAYLMDGTETGTVTMDQAYGNYYSSHVSGFAGTSVALAEDMDGDGLGELVIGVPRYDDEDSDGIVYEDVGAVYIVNGGIAGAVDITSSADVILNGEHSGDAVGDCVASVGDVTGDSLGDILVSAPYGGPSSTRGPGRVYLVQGDSTLIGEQYLSFMSTAKFDGPSDDTTAVLCPSAPAGDMDLDGLTDIILGAYGHDLNGTDAGSAWLYLAPFGGTISTSSAAASFLGDAADDAAGYAVAAAGDTNGDGFPDLLVGAPYNDAAGTDAGATYLLLGSPLIVP